MLSLAVAGEPDDVEYSHPSAAHVHERDSAERNQQESQGH